MKAKKYKHRRRFARAGGMVALSLFLCGFFSVNGFGISPSRSVQDQSSVERDIDFALLLKDVYVDLAEDFIKRLEKKPGIREAERAQIRLVRSEVVFRRASIQPDIDKKIGMIEESVEIIEEFVKEFPDHPKMEEARSRIGELSREAGGAIVEALKKETDPAKIKTLRERGDKYFKEAENFFNKQKHREPDPNLDFDAPLAEIYFNLPKTQFRHAFLYEKNDPQRNFLLREALRNLDEALFDFGDPYYGGTYDAYITRGLLFRELGEWKRALDSFESAIQIKDIYADERDPNKYHWDNLGRTIVANALVELCRAANHFEDYKTTLQASDFAFELFPDLKFYPRGWNILLEKAKALAETEQPGEAQKAVDQVIQANRGGPFARRARELVANWLGDVENATASQLILGAQAEMQKGNLSRSLGFLKKAIRRAGQKTGQKASAAEAFYWMGRFLDRKGRDDEAVLAYLRVPEIDPDFQSPPDAPYRVSSPDALYRAAANLALLSGSGGSFYEKLYRTTVRRLTETYPNSSEAKRAELFVALRLEGEQKWTEAAKIYEAIPENSDNYEVAVNRGAFCYYMLAHDYLRQAKLSQAQEVFKRAESSYERALEWAVKKIRETIDERRQEELRALAFGSTVQIAEINLNKAANKPDKVLTLLDGLEQTYSDPAKISKIFSLRVRAFIELERLDEAGATLDRLLDEAPLNQRGISSSCRALAARLERDAQQRAARSNRDLQIKTNLRKAFQYYVEWIKRGRASGELRRDIENVLTAADRVVHIGFKMNSELSESATTVIQLADQRILDRKYWEVASEFYGSLLQSPYHDRLGNRGWAIRVKLGRCLAVLGNWSRLAQVYETLVQTEDLVNPLTKRLNVRAFQEKPELLFAYSGLGYAYFRLAEESKDPDLFQKATEIFARVQENTVQDTDLWWTARYLIVSVLYGQGNYRIAKQVIESILRSYPDWDNGKFGFRSKFESLKVEVYRRAP